MTNYDSYRIECIEYGVKPVLKADFERQQEQERYEMDKRLQRKIRENQLNDKIEAIARG